MSNYTYTNKGQFGNINTQNRTLITLTTFLKKCEKSRDGGSSKILCTKKNNNKILFIDCVFHKKLQGVGIFISPLPFFPANPPYKCDNK